MPRRRPHAPHRPVGRFLKNGRDQPGARAVRSAVAGGRQCDGLITGETGPAVAAAHGSAVHGAERHFNGDDEEDGYHCDEASHGGVGFVPEGRETWVGKGGEGGWEELWACWLVTWGLSPQNPGRFSDVHGRTQ